MSNEVQWNILCQEQGWNDITQKELFKRFVSEVGLMGSFVTYAREVADQENKEAQLNF